METPTVSCQWQPICFQNRTKPLQTTTSFWHRHPSWRNSILSLASGKKPGENTYNRKTVRKLLLVHLARCCRLSAHVLVSHPCDGVARRRALHVMPDLSPVCLVPCKHRISCVCISGALLEQRESSEAAILLPRSMTQNVWLKIGFVITL